MDALLTSKESALQALLQDYGSVAVAFSGGVDSALLLDVAHEVLGSQAVALTASMAGLPARELLAARTFCTEHDIRHLEVAFDEFAIPGFSENPPDRCYLCKRALLSALLALAGENDISQLVDGSNLDDEYDYRPGKVALAELNIPSPLKDIGFTKADIRTLSQKRGLSSWNKPSLACLATRLPFGTPLTSDLLRRIDKAEQNVLDLGARQVRVRVHHDLARIEVDEESIPLLMERMARQHLATAFHELAFTYTALDIQGYRSGSMNTERA